MENDQIEVLIVEDSPTQAARLEYILRQEKFRVEVAPDGVQALESLSRRLPRLVITDVVMPRMDGYELCQRIKADPRLQHIPVILLTSLSDVGDVLRGLECFADSFVVKPYEPAQLLARIEYVLANEKLRASREGDPDHLGKIELFFAGHSHFLARLPRVENTIDLLLGAYETMVEKNIALQAAREEAEQARLSAEKANKAKSAFLSSMSHELRTPLNAVLGFAQLLEMRESDEHKRDSLQQILKGGQHLLELINEVLDVARIEAGRLELVTEPVDVRDVIAEVMALLQPLAATAQVTLTELPDSIELPPLMADRQRLQQVFINLISNAIKYNREGGSVRLWAGLLKSGRVRIAVTDTGHGISPEKLPRLFSPFERLDAGNSSIQGAGLGLVLSKGLVEAMNGSVQVQSQLGVGTTFLLELPALETASPPLPPVRHVLCVDDDPQFIHLLRSFLCNRPGYTLTAALTGEEALQTLRASEPCFDLLLLDYHLPDMKGHELCAELQRDTRLADLPVVVISGDPDLAEKKRLFWQNPASYLSKPFDLLEFFAAVDSALAKSGAVPA